MNRLALFGGTPTRQKPFPAWPVFDENEERALLDTFKEDEILDLMAYMLSRGDRNHAMFKKQ